MMGTRNFGHGVRKVSLYGYRQPEPVRPEVLLDLWQGMALHQIKDSATLDQLAASEYKTIQARTDAYKQAVLAWQSSWQSRQGETK